MALNPQVTGNAGLYYCCYMLSLRDWNVMPTARNARGVDILIYDSDAKHKFGIQVKSLSKRSPVPLGTSLDKIMGDYWIIVNNVASKTDSPSAFILLPGEVKSLAQPNKEGKEAYWLQPRAYEDKKYQFREAWDRIGRDYDQSTLMSDALHVPQENFNP